jgi:TolB protein
MWRAALVFAYTLGAFAAQYENPSWAPDGKSIVFVMKTAGSDWNIYTANMGGSEVRQLTHGSAWDPAWSPDGKSIAFVSTVESKRQISAMSADGSNVRLLTSGPGEHFHPAFSPAGSRLALTTVDSGTSRIAVMDSSGKNSKPVTPLDQRARWPAWSPDGKCIAYFVQGPANEIWQVDVDTLERAKLFDLGPGPTTLDWSADSKRIVFTRQDGKETGIDVLDCRLARCGASGRRRTFRASLDGRRTGRKSCLSQSPASTYWI